MKLAAPTTPKVEPLKFSAFCTWRRVNNKMNAFFWLSLIVRMSHKYKANLSCFGKFEKLSSWSIVAIYCVRSVRAKPHVNTVEISQNAPKRPRNLRSHRLSGHTDRFYLERVLELDCEGKNAKYWPPNRLITFGQSRRDV